MNATEFIQQQLSTAGWAPIHYELATFLCKGAAGSHLDFQGLANSLPELPKRFARTELCTARINGFGEVPILYRSPLVLAERIGFLTGGTVELVDATSKPMPLIRQTTTGDALALAHAGVETKEPPRRCLQCGNLNQGRCIAAFQGKIEGAPSEYHPDASWPRRCLAYAPPRMNYDEAVPSNYDRRTGRELWPELVQ